MQIETQFDCNGLVFISAPRSNEEGPSRRMQEDLDQLFSSLELKFRYITIKSEEELMNFLRSLEPEIKSGFLPIIHFDTHGSEEHGLEIGTTGELVSWYVITEELRRLNIASGNNLFVFLAACYGFHLIKSLTLEEPSPFFIMLGSSNTVTFGELESSVLLFYKKLFVSSNVNDAASVLTYDFEYFHSERMFLTVFAKYIRENCLGKGGKERREKLLTEVIESLNITNTSINLKELRSQIKQQTKPTPELMNIYALRFMHGKRCSISFEEFMIEVKQSYSIKYYSK